MPVKKMMKPEVAMMRLEVLCSRSEQCSFELRQKLSRWGINDGDAEAIITHLCQHRYVDDSRFARAYCNDKLQFNRWGKVKIMQGLVAKHIPRDIISSALDEIDECQYRTILVELLRTKMRTLTDAHSYEDKARLFRFALSRGFESSIASDVIKQLWTKAIDSE